MEIPGRGSRKRAPAPAGPEDPPDDPRTRSFGPRLGDREIGARTAVLMSLRLRPSTSAHRTAHRTASGRLAVLLLMAFLALETLGRCCCLPAAPDPVQASCHGGHQAAAPVSHGAECSCELHALALDPERSSGSAAPLPASPATLPLLALVEEALPPPSRIAPDERRDLPPPDPESAPPGLRAPPRS